MSKPVAVFLAAVCLVGCTRTSAQGKTETVTGKVVDLVCYARNKANTRQWLFGVTPAGVVMVELPVITNPLPTRPLWGPPIR